MKASLLSIAGYDPTGGAGLLQDVAAFRAYGWHGLAVPTVLVAEDSIQVVMRREVEPRLLQQMFELLRVDFQIAGVKLGLLGSSPAQLQVVGAFLHEIRFGRFCPIVADPVLSNSQGDALTDDSWLPNFTKWILPYIDVLTPNVHELATILGEKGGQEPAKIERLAREYHHRYGTQIVVTGVALPAASRRAGDRQRAEVVEDLAFDGARLTHHRSERFSGDPHGTGCLHSALLLMALTSGKTLQEAATWSKGEMVKRFAAAVRPASSGRPFLPVGLV